MQLKRSTDILLRILMYLASHPQVDHISIHDLSEALNWNKNLVVKVAHIAVQQGLLKAVRGRTGGVALAKPASDYRIGDDIRDIDWNVTARNRKPYIKVYEEERELTMMLLVDVSASRMFGTQGQLKKNLITEIAAVLAFSAAQNNDKIGCIFFSDRIEKYIPPKKGRQHVLRIISDLERGGEEQ